MKVYVDRDEWYVWSAVAKQSKSQTFIELDVDPKIARRWIRAQQEFARAHDEISGAIHGVKEPQP